MKEDYTNTFLFGYFLYSLIVHILGGIHSVYRHFGPNSIYRGYLLPNPAGQFLAITYLLLSILAIIVIIKKKKHKTLLATPLTFVIYSLVFGLIVPLYVLWAYSLQELEVIVSYETYWSFIVYLIIIPLTIWNFLELNKKTVREFFAEFFT
jgi:hypothetical protein